jgi:hypothetical protein
MTHTATLFGVALLALLALFVVVEQVRGRH